MSAFEGVGIKAVAAYESLQSDLLPGVKGKNVTEVGGTLETAFCKLDGKFGFRIWLECNEESHWVKNWAWDGGTGAANKPGACWCFCPAVIEDRVTVEMMQ